MRLAASHWEHALNPYASPTSQAGHAPSHPKVFPKVIAWSLAGIFFVVSSLGVLQFFFESLRWYLLPRFGGIGLILCLNPLNFLTIWIFKGGRRSLLAASWMTLTVGLCNAAMLLWSGTVSVIDNPFLQRLHSSWGWSVATMIVAGGLLFWAARNVPEDVQSDSVIS